MNERASPTTVGLSVLVKDTGESARTLQHWSDLGILKPVASTHKQGRGYHREFPAAPPWYGERMWALFASALNRLRIPLGDIKLIIDNVRPSTTDTAAAGEPPAGWPVHLNSNAIGQALQGKFVIIAIGVAEDKELRWATLRSEDSAEELKELYIFEKGTLSPTHPIEFYNNISLSIPWDHAAQYVSNYMINLSLVFAPLVQKRS